MLESLGLLGFLSFFIKEKFFRLHSPIRLAYKPATERGRLVRRVRFEPAAARPRRDFGGASGDIVPDHL
jgi:hypothetical protein